MTWQRRRRHEIGPFYVNTNRFIPTSWGIHVGRVTRNETNHRTSIKLPFGLGAWSFGGGRRR
jgi:hypothetical protein